MLNTTLPVIGKTYSDISDSKNVYFGYDAWVNKHIFMKKQPTDFALVKLASEEIHTMSLCEDQVLSSLLIEESMLPALLTN